MFFVIYDAQSGHHLNPKLQFKWEGFQVLPHEFGVSIDILAQDGQLWGGLSADEVRLLLPSIEGSITIHLDSPFPNASFKIGCWLIGNLRRYLIDFALPHALLQPVTLERRVEPLMGGLAVPVPGGLMSDRISGDIRLMGIPSHTHIKGLLKTEEEVITLSSPMQDEEGYLVFDYTPVLEKNNQISYVPCFMVRGDKDRNHRQVRAQEYLPGLRWDVLSQVDTEVEIMVVAASMGDARSIGEGAIARLRSRGYIDAPAYGLRIPVTVLGTLKEGPMTVGELPGVQGLSTLSFRVRLLNLIQNMQATVVEDLPEWSLTVTPRV
jgi:hypothetical protein